MRRVSTAWALDLALFACGCSFDLVPPRVDGGVTPSSDIVCLFGAGDVEAQHLGGLAAFPNGGMEVTGDFSGTMSFGTAALANPSSDQAGYVAKLDAACAPLWAQSFKSSHADVLVPAVAADGDRQLVGGSFAVDVDLDGMALSAPATDGREAFIAALDSGGRRQAVLHLGGAGLQIVNTLAAGAGVIVAAGAFSTEVRVGSSGADAAAPLISGTSATQGFVIGLASSETSLTPIWSTALSMSATASGQGANAAAIDAIGAVFVTGVFSGTLTIAAGSCSPIAAMGPANMFVAKLSPAGACVWVRGLGADLATGIAIDSKGDAVVTGSFKGSVDFGDKTWTATADNHNALLAKLSGADGSTKWSLGFGDDEEQHGMGVVVGTDDAIFLTVDLSGSADFDPRRDGGDVQSIGGADVLAAKYDSAGDLLWARRYGDAGAQRDKRIGVDATGSAALAGELGGGTLGDGPTALKGDTRMNVFVMRIPP